MRNGAVVGVYEREINGRVETIVVELRSTIDSRASTWYWIALDAGRNLMEMGESHDTWEPAAKTAAAFIRLKRGLVAAEFQ